jgi:hypothetical protein
MNARFERGVRKVAIYAINGNVTHAAAQPVDKNGRWHSKIGFNVNILHDLQDLVGHRYGEVVKILRQRKPSPQQTVLRERLVITRTP